jgi:hypothetical protein
LVVIANATKALAFARKGDVLGISENGPKAFKI